MSDTDGERSARTIDTRGLLSELIAFARARRNLVLLLLLAPTVIFYGVYLGRNFSGAGTQLVRWKSDVLRFNTMEELIQHRLQSDRELTRLRAVAHQHRATPSSSPASTTTESLPESTHLLIVGGTLIHPPSPADPGLAATVRAVLIDPDVELPNSERPTLAALPSEDSSFHGLIELIRSKLETLPQADILVEYSLSTERCANGIARADENCPPHSTSSRTRDFQELAFLGNGRFFGAVAIFPLLDSPFTAYPSESLHTKLVTEIESAGLRALDVLTHIRELDVEDFRSPDSATQLTPYGQRVYAHILAGYLECTRLIPTRVFVKDRSGCRRPKRTVQSNPPKVPTTSAPPAATAPRKK